MSTLPPLPPDVQAELDQRLPEIENTLNGFIKALRHDPKRDPNNLPDYHNTVAAMLIQAEQTIPGGPELNRHMARWRSSSSPIRVGRPRTAPRACPRWPNPPVRSDAPSEPSAPEGSDDHA